MRKVYDIDDDDDDESMQVDEDDDSGEINEETVSDDPATIITNSSQQVQNLLLKIREFIQNRKDMKGLIFVQRRYTARILCHVIRRYFNAHPNLNVHVDFMTGRNAFMPDSIETVISNKNNNQVLDKFKRGAINLIIATSVLEEGIDLQECNLVISYDVPQTFRSYVQTKGRARMKDSTYAILAPAGEIQKLHKKKQEWEQVLKLLKEVSFNRINIHIYLGFIIKMEYDFQYLVEKTVDRQPPQQDDIDKAIEQKLNKKLTTRKGATVDYLSAISLLNRYCTSLPRDQFTEPLPQWEDLTEKGADKKPFIIKIVLPIQSPLKMEILVRIYSFQYCIELINIENF